MATPLEDCLTGLTDSFVRDGTGCTDLQLIGSSVADCQALTCTNIRYLLMTLERCEQEVAETVTNKETSKFCSTAICWVRSTEGHTGPLPEKGIRTGW